MNEDNFYELVVKYLSKETTAAENAQVKQYIKKENYKKIYDKLCMLWKNTVTISKEENFNYNNGLNNLTEKILRQESGFQWDEEQKPKIFILQPLFLKAAASIVFLLIMSFAAMYIFGVFDRQPTVLSWNEKSTIKGEKFILTLVDGSKITLNADSKLKYPERFGEETRDIYLEGEGYFEVAHNSSKPFIVHSAGINTTVLGTTFNIRSFPEERDIEISLMEGSVKVSSNTHANQKGEIILEPNQQLIYNRDTEVNKVKYFDEQKVTGWKDNHFIYENEPLSKVFADLERAYGIKFELAEKSFYNKKIKANLNNASLWTISETIKKATGLEYKTIKENNVTKKIVFFK